MMIQNNNLNLNEYLLIASMKCLSEKVYNLLKESGLTDEQIEIIDKYSAILGWGAELSKYLNCRLQDINCCISRFEQIILEVIIPSIRDFDIEIKMKNFLNNPNKSLANEIFNDLNKHVITESIQDLLKQTHNLLLNNNVVAGQGNTTCQQ